VDAIAMVRDVFPVEQCSRIISMLILILGVSSLLGPTVGGGVATTLGWHWIFLILAIIVHRHFAPTRSPAGSRAAARSSMSQVHRSSSWTCSTSARARWPEGAAAWH
jgi:MFS family permease